ncbi:MAG TPA: Gfo/Idh/MocA family oxidoreductase [Acidimicrobiales bacterium]|nr:Gfo/Idh/MocA family oxidoreductase [Acidimicrobiales bacterium]
MSAADGMNYAPQGKPRPVVGPGEFVVAAVGLDHGHIYGMCNGLVEAGATVKWAYDPDPAKVVAFCERFPSAKPARTELEAFEDGAVHLVASAAVPFRHGPLGLRVMDHGKDYFTDKPALTTIDQVEQVRRAVATSGRKFSVYFSERLHVESAVYASQLVSGGAIGQVVHVLGLGPHRANLAARPTWFFERDSYGGILCDIGSHQVEQFLHYTGNEQARVVASRVGNFAHPAHPGLEDFGDCTLTGANGAAGYFRVDWFTPDGLSAWGDGRVVLLGTKGYIELRKYVDVSRGPGDQVFLVDDAGEHHFSVGGQVGYPFFGQLVLDCLERTERAMSQAHILRAAELCIVAEAGAEVVAGPDASASALPGN